MLPRPDQHMAALCSQDRNAIIIPTTRADLCHAMKHPLKKFTSDEKLTDDLRQSIAGQYEERTIRTGKRIPSNTPLHVIIDNAGKDERLVKGFQIVRAGAPRLITPEPDLTVLLFHSAYLNWNALKKSRRKMEDRLTTPRISEQVLDDLFEFYSIGTNIVSSLWLALESSINRQFQAHHTYQRPGGERRTFTGEQLVDLGMEDKIRDVLPALTGKRYRDAKGNQWDDLFKLKHLRDSILHPKRTHGQGTWAPLYRSLYAHNYLRSFGAVKSFINFYEDRDLIQDCTCSSDW